MAYISSSIGNDTHGDGSRTYPYKTVAKFQTITPNKGSIDFYLDYINEDNIKSSVNGIGVTQTVIDGTSLSGYAITNHGFAAFVLSINNVIIENFTYVFQFGWGMVLSNSIIRNNINLFSGSYGFSRGMENNLFYNNTISGYLSLGNDTTRSKKNNTFHNQPLVLTNASCGNTFAYNIYSDVDITSLTTNTDQYSLFYGNCTIWNGSAFIPISSISELTTYGNGTYTGCEVMPNVSATFSSNLAGSGSGSGSIRVRKTAHGLTEGDYITIRVQDDYLISRTQVTYVDANNFDLNDVEYVSGYNTLEYNYPLFVNEFAGDFNVWEGSKATLMNNSDAYSPIGWGQAAIPLSVSNFTTNTNITLTEQSGYSEAELTATTSNGTLDNFNVNGQTWFDFEAPTNIDGIIVNSQKDYANGRYLTSTPQLTETTFSPGASLDAGYYKVEIGAVVYATKTYNVDDGFYATAGTNFSTSASGIARLFTGGQQERSATIQIQFKQQGIESDVIKLIIGSTGNIVNYQSNDPSTFKITYGNGDSSFDSGNAFPLYAINSYKILEQTMQNGDRSAVI